MLCSETVQFAISLFCITSLSQLHQLLVQFQVLLIIYKVLYSAAQIRLETALLEIILHPISATRENLFKFPWLQVLKGTWVKYKKKKKTNSPCLLLPCHYPESPEIRADGFLSFFSGCLIWADGKPCLTMLCWPEGAQFFYILLFYPFIINHPSCQRDLISCSDCFTVFFHLLLNVLSCKAKNANWWKHTHVDCMPAISVLAQRLQGKGECITKINYAQNNIVI